MAIENIQYVYDHIRFYRSALKPFLKDFVWLQKEQQIRTTKNLRENAVEAVKSYLGPQNMIK